MQQKGYAQQAILNYVKGINLYLDYMGLSDIRITRGRAKDIRNLTFGYLTPTLKQITDGGNMVVAIIIIVVLIVVIILSCCMVSGDCSREEEERDIKAQLEKDC